MPPIVNSQKRVVVVIPIHSPAPSDYELISFRQCFAVLGRHPIRVLAPAGMELAAYRAAVPAFEAVFIDPKWQQSVWAYNRLKTSRFFYRLFNDYQFLLTYELDAFVFRDDLLYWCDQDYDYIGAPWFEGFAEAGEDRAPVGVGNSGFSLRKVAPIERLLKDLFYKEPLEYRGRLTTRLKTYGKFPFRWLFHVVVRRWGENYTVQHNFSFHEDIFFGRVAARHAPGFRVAPVDAAARFSFELRPQLLFELAGDTLPMGCHAWWRYALDFWRPHIERCGYSL